ncbi:hypothetical protein [Burkholderia sp. Ac-20365]|uniref:hypothetical protein n=1 Tax=Burkholderia sp. Ac-20365 TaxID=2703897 RepID=UPI001F12090A|nr:hypothetical protein [Burkholderia sp. Ac-20365]
MPGEEALATLSEYLERALNQGRHLIMVRSEGGTSVLYLGEVGSSDGEPAKCGVIQNELADAILEATRSGFNDTTINDVRYRFIRTFTELSGRGAVVFAAA